MTARGRGGAARTAAGGAAAVLAMAGGLALAALAVLPESAHAMCPVCFDRDDEARVAFLATTGLLTLLPIGLVAGTGTWLRRRAREMEEDEGGDGADGVRDEAGRGDHARGERDMRE